MKNLTDRNTNDLKLEDVIADIECILKDSGLTPDGLTVKKYGQLGGKYDGRNLRRIGGFKAIMAEAFATKKQVDVNTSRWLQRRSTYVNGLEKKLADRENLQATLISNLTNVYKQFGPMQVSRSSTQTRRHENKIDRANVAVISDIHLGLDIDIEEVLTNKYNWLIGAHRLGKFADQVATYKLDHRDECGELRLVLNGDLGQGVIHPDGNTDPIGYQCYGITKYLTAMIDYWRKFYKHITVEFTPDNHMRIPRGSDRDFSEKTINNFSTFGVLLGLQNAFRLTTDVTFNVTKAPLSTFHLLGHKYVATHGDTCLSSGNVGSSIDVKRIANQILKLNASVTDGKHYDAVILGHVHVATFLFLNETNSYLCINGSGSGTDPYAQSQSFFRTRPSQILFEVTKSHAVGDFRIVTLDDADMDKTYEHIIRPYEYEIKI